VLGLLGGVGVIGLTGALSGCSPDSVSETTPSSATPAAPSEGTLGSGPAAVDSAVTVAAGEIPEETAGPFPGDGSNGPNVLTESGVVRSDITTSFGGASGVAEGVPLTIRLRIYDLNGESVTPLPGAAVYLWHCDREGNYSLYSEAAAEENYLRGVQQADADGNLEFRTIFPAAYDGRWPHAHFEVYESLAKATSASNKLRT
jgi:protocatechuate 3,4-dioxygenase beta subunit